MAAPDPDKRETKTIKEDQVRTQTGDKGDKSGSSKGSSKKESGG